MFAGSLRWRSGAVTIAPTMKRLLIFALTLLVTLPLLAAPRKARNYKSGTEVVKRKLPSDPGRLSRLVSQYEAYRTGVGASAIGDMRSARLLLFPAAGSVAGANGVFFKSDVTLVSFNPDDHQHIVAIWLRNGANTDDPPAVELTLDADTYYTFEDFVGTVLERTNELGSILIIPVDDEGDINFADAAIDGFSRIWTPQPNASGTVSQPFEATDPFSFYVFETATIMGLRQDTQYRTNYGIVNIDDVPHTFNVHFLGENQQTTSTITIPAGGMVHQAIPQGNYGPLVIEMDVDDPEAPWIGYGTSNDNITGDGWVSIGSGLLRPADLDDIDGGF